MTRAAEESNRHMLRARDAMDRDYAKPLDIPTLAQIRETDHSVTEICFDVGFRSLGTFSRTFTDIVGEPPTTYRWRAADLRAVPACFAKAWMRPSSFGEAMARREH